MMRVVLLSLCAASVLASCPNDCSGHGACNTYSACECMRNWMGADCSERVCMFSRSYVDTPQGDLNSDGFLDRSQVKTVILGATNSFWADDEGTACAATGTCACPAPGCTTFFGDGASKTKFSTYFSDASPTAAIVASSATDSTGITVDAATGMAQYDVLVVPCRDGTETTVREIDSVATNTLTVSTYANSDGCTGGLTAGTEYNGQTLTAYSPTDTYLASDIYATDEYTTSRDPYNFVSSCNRLMGSNTITHAVKVEVSNDFPAPAAFTESLMYVPKFTATGTDKVGDAEYASTIATDLDQGDASTYTQIVVCAVSGTTYKTQWSPKMEWERFPDDHGVGAPDSVSSMAKYDEAHFFKECAGKGMCDRSTGECDCYPGWEGTGCMRTACPEGCSGHGFCKRIMDVTDNYLGWDGAHSQHCVCEPGYEGADCSLRTCPKGHDPIHRGLADEVQTITLHNYNQLRGPGVHTGDANGGSVVGDEVNTNTAGGSNLELGDGREASMALVFTDDMGDEWATPSFLIKPAGETAAMHFTSYTDGVPTGLVITEPGSGYDPSDSATATPGNNAGTNYLSVTTANGCTGTMLVVFNQDGQATGVDVSDITACSGIPVIAIAPPPRPGRYTSFWYAAKGMAAALEALPNNVIPAVTITVDCGDDDNDNVYATGVLACNGDTEATPESATFANDKDVRFHITFTDNSGDIPALGVRFGNSQVRGMGYAEDYDGSAYQQAVRPTAATVVQAWKFDSGAGAGGDTTDATVGPFDARWSCENGVSGASVFGSDNGGDVTGTDTAKHSCSNADAYLGWVDNLLTLAETVKGTKINDVCSRRGLCDYSTGECQCFSGFTDVDCHVQNALAMG